MQSRSALIVKASRSTATLQATRDLTTTSVLQAVACVNALPEDVRAVCVDLRNVRIANPLAARALDLGLSVWRTVRRGMTWVRLPAHGEATILRTTVGVHQPPSLRPRGAHPQGRPSRVAFAMR